MILTTTLMSSLQVSPDKKIETQKLCPFGLFIESGWGFSSFILKQRNNSFQD